MSIAGGYHRSVEAAAAAGCDCVQLFTKNNNQWRAKPISDDEARKFREALATKNISFPLSHASYLINLAAPDEVLRKKSIEAMVIELERAAQLGIPHVVVHPGAYTTSTAEQGIAQIMDSLNQILARTHDLPTTILLENTAGQGTTLGRTLEELAAILVGLDTRAHRLGVCIDTCHAFAAGYDLHSEIGFKKFVQDLDRIIGLSRVKAIHLNDSKKPLGSRVDRHEHIGDGELGIDAFRRLLKHPRLRKIPMYLETEKGFDSHGVDWDVVNLTRLRHCLGE